MKRTSILKVLAPVLMLMFVFAIFPLKAYADYPEIVNDNGSGSSFDRLPTNYVQITNLNLATASIVSNGGGWTLENGYIGTTGNQIASRILVWYGGLHYGSRNTTNDKAASLHTNNLPNVSIRFPNGAVKAGGGSADVIMTLSEVTCSVGKPKNSRIRNGTRVGVCMVDGWGSLMTADPRTTIAYPYPQSKNYSAQCTTANRFKVTISVVEPGTLTPISSSTYPSMLLVFKDLDIRSKDVKKSASAAALWNGFYSEGIEMVSGWMSPVVLAPHTGDIGNTCLVDVQSVNGNAKIKANGPVMKNFINTFNPPAGDFGSYYSGFAAGVRPQGFSFYWTGSIQGANGTMGTSLGGQPTVAVNAMRKGVCAQQSYLGCPGGASGVNSWYTNTHLMNSSATYTATPARGAYIESLKVEGVEQDLTEEERLTGKSYFFSKLNKYPVEHRDIRNGQVVASGGSGVYYIEASFNRLPKYTAKKSVDKDTLRVGTDEELLYTIVCDEIYDKTLSGEHKLHDDLAGGLLDIDPDSIEVSTEYGSCEYTLDENGLDIIFKSETVTGNLPSMVLTYKAKVNWDKYEESRKDKIENVLYGKNRPEVGGDETGNKISIPVTSDIIVRKSIAGRLRDDTKKFEFEVIFNGLKPNGTYVFESIGGGDIVRATTGSLYANGFKATREGEAIILFTAKGNQGFKILNLPIGCTYQIREAASDHIASYKISSTRSDAVIAKAEDANNYNRKELATEVETLDKVDEIVTIAYTNTRNAATVTGVLVRYGWMIAAVILVLLLTALFFVKKKGGSHV
jgi:hypothetical protein